LFVVLKARFVIDTETLFVPTLTFPLWPPSVPVAPAPVALRRKKAAAAIANRFFFIGDNAPGIFMRCLFWQRTQSG